MEKRMATTRRKFLDSTSVACLATLGSSSLLHSKSAAQVSNSAPIKMVQTPVLDIGYEEHGPEDGFPIILLHGFPYDVRSFDGVYLPLAAAGYRVLLPYLRGFGPTRFRDPSAPRMAEQAAIAQDLIDFADALGIDQFAVAGFDWGNRAACIAAILHPQRIRAQVAVDGYSVQDTITPDCNRIATISFAICGTVFPPDLSTLTRPTLVRRRHSIIPISST